MFLGSTNRTFEYLNEAELTEIVRKRNEAEHENDPTLLNLDQDEFDLRTLKRLAETAAQLGAEQLVADLSSFNGAPVPKMYETIKNKAGEIIAAGKQHSKIIKLAQLLENYRGRALVLLPPGCTKLAATIANLKLKTNIGIEIGQNLPFGENNHVVIDIATEDLTTMLFDAFQCAIEFVQDPNSRVVELSDSIEHFVLFVVPVPAKNRDIDMPSCSVDDEAGAKRTNPALGLLTTTSPASLQEHPRSPLSSPDTIFLCSPKMAQNTALVRILETTSDVEVRPTMTNYIGNIDLIVDSQTAIVLIGQDELRDLAACKRFVEQSGRLAMAYRYIYVLIDWDSDVSSKAGFIVKNSNQLRIGLSRFTLESSEMQLRIVHAKGASETAVLIKQIIEHSLRNRINNFEWTNRCAWVNDRPEPYTVSKISFVPMRRRNSIRRSHNPL